MTSAGRGTSHDEWCVGRHDDTGACLNVYLPGRTTAPCWGAFDGVALHEAHDYDGKWCPGLSERTTSPWGAAYLDTTELTRRLRRVLRRLDDRCAKPEIMTEAERTLTRDYCREMETLHARREANDA